jgi:hypothetical protein
MIESTFYGLWPSARSAYYQSFVAVDGAWSAIQQAENRCSNILWVADSIQSFFKKSSSITKQREIVNSI